MYVSVLDGCSWISVDKSISGNIISGGLTREQRVRGRGRGQKKCGGRIAGVEAKYAQRCKLELIGRQVVPIGGNHT